MKKFQSASVVCLVYPYNAVGFFMFCVRKFTYRALLQVLTP